MNLQAYIALGWSPIFANATTNGSVIQEVVGWVGGNGTAPVTGVYVGSNGFVTNITDGVDIRGAAGGGGGAAISAGGVSQNTGTVNFSNSNGVTFGLSNNGVMTASIFTNYQSTGNYLTTAAQSNQVVNSLNGSTGQISLNVGSSLSSSTNGSSITFGLASNITTALQSAGAYLTTAAQSNQVVNSVNAKTGQVSFAVGSSLSSSTNGNSTTWGLASNITTALQSAGAYLTTAMQSNAATISNINVSAGSTSTNASAFTFSNQNGVTFGLGTGASAGVITASVAAAGGAQTGISGISAGTTMATSGTVSFADSNGITWGMNGNTMTATVATNYQSQGAYLTTADLSQNSSKYIQNWKLSGNTSGTTSSAQGTDLWLAGANGVTLSGSSNTISFSVATNYQSQGAYLTTADLSANSSKYVQNWKLTGNTSGTTSSAQGTDLWLAGGNGVTISGSSNTLSFSVATNYQSQGAYLTTARASNDAIGTNTAQSNVTWTVNSSGLSLDARGYAGTGTSFGGTNISASMTHNSNGLTISASVAAPGGGGGAAISASNSSQNTGTVSFANSNGVTFGMSNGTMTASVGAGGFNGNMNWYALGNTTQNSSSVINTSVISLNFLGGITGGYTNGSIQVSAPPVSSLSGVSPVYISTNGSTISVGLNTYTALSFANRQLGASTSLAPGQSSLWLAPARLDAPVSASTFLAMMSFSGTITSATTAQFGASLYFGIWSQHSTDPNRFDTYWTGAKSFTAWNSGTSSYSYSYDTFSGSSAGSNLGTASVMGARLLTIAINSTIPSGLYIFGSMMITSSAGYSAAMSRAVAIMDNPLGVGMGYMGSATNTSLGYADGGKWSAQTAALPATISIGHIVQSSNVMPYFKIGAI